MQYIAKKTYRPKHRYEGIDQPIFKIKSETSKNPFLAINSKEGFNQLPEIEINMLMER